MSVLVATSDGYHVFSSSGAHVTALDGHTVDAFTPAPDASWVAIVDGRELWRHADDGAWTPLTSSDMELTSVCAHRGSVFVGAYDALLFRLDDGALVEVPGFTSAPGRDEWHAVGPPLNVRSMTSTADDGALLANVHVGGILRSTDGGATWTPTLPVDDGGASWTVETDGLPHTYARAVTVAGERVLMSISEGPFARRSALYEWVAGSGSLARVEDGLPDEGLHGNVDTACLAADGGDVALADGGGDVWLRRHGTSWERIATAVGDVRAVALA